jgi:hypothetical protein
MHFQHLGSRGSAGSVEPHWAHGVVDANANPTLSPGGQMQRQSCGNALGDRERGQQSLGAGARADSAVWTER